MRFDLPTTDQETEPFWEACRRGQLLVQRCGACGHVYAYARPFCPACWSEDVAWVEASGRGTLYTWSTVHRNDLPPFGDRVPYVAAIVELEEGPRLMTNVVDASDDRLEIGMPLEVTFRSDPDPEVDLTVPVFRPVA